MKGKGYLGKKILRIKTIAYKKKIMNAGAPMQNIKVLAQTWLALPRPSTTFFTNLKKKMQIDSKWYETSYKKPTQK